MVQRAETAQRHGDAPNAPKPNKNSHAGTHRVGGVSVEVFWAPTDDESIDDLERGWYWWACQPGCLPDGDPMGPFNTSLEAYEDAFASYQDSLDELGQVPPTGHDVS